MKKLYFILILGTLLTGVATYAQHPISGVGGVVSGISSVFGRLGAVVATSGDYTAAQVTNAVDKTAANTYTGGGLQDFSAMKVKPADTTVSGLPPASSNTNVEYIVTDGASAIDCSAGSGTTRVICISNGTSWVPAGQVISAVKRIEWKIPAVCNNATATAIWGLPTSNAPAPTCYGTSYRFGTLDYADAGNTTAVFSFPLPAGWTSTIDINLSAFVNGTSQSVKATIATVCVPTSSDILNPTFNAAQTVTVTSPGTANQRFLFTQTSVTTTGCSAGNLMLFKIGRDVTDTSTLTYSIAGAEIDYQSTYN